MDRHRQESQLINRDYKMKRSLVVSSLLSEINDKEPDEVHIYSLYDGDDCIYVGQSRNIEKRIFSHLADGKKFSRVDYFTCSLGDANLCEADTIVELNPRLNKNLPSTEKYMTMSSFKKDLCDAVTEVEDGLGVVFKSKKSNGNQAKFITIESKDYILGVIVDAINSMGNEHEQQ